VTRTCTTIATTMMTARTTEAWTATIWRWVAAASGGGGWMMSEFLIFWGTCTQFVTAWDVLFSGGNLIKKPLCPNLNHIIPEVGTKQFNKGTNNGPKATDTLMDLGNMLLLPKLAKQREFDPCKSWAAVVPESLLRKIRQVREAQAENFWQQRSDQILGFCGT
jgi:hypothetical protein